MRIRGPRPLQLVPNLTKKATNLHCLFPFIKMSDIANRGSWHSCLQSLETLAPFLEFPREWPPATLRHLGILTILRTAVEQLPSFPAFMGSLSRSGNITDIYVHTMAVTSRCFLIETAPLVAAIDLHEWRAYFFERNSKHHFEERLI